MRQTITTRSVLRAMRDALDRAEAVLEDAEAEAYWPGATLAVSTDGASLCLDSHLIDALPGEPQVLSQYPSSRAGRVQQEVGVVVDGLRIYCIRTRAATMVIHEEVADG